MQREVLVTFLPPTQLPRKTSAVSQNAKYNLTLNPEQVNIIKKIVELRVCMLNDLTQEQLDAHPTDLRVGINYRVCEIPAAEPTENSSLKYFPIDLTPYLKLNKTVLSKF